MGKITDSWSTPQEVFDAIAAKHGPFELDAAASEGNAKCVYFYTEADNALKKGWRYGCVPSGDNYHNNQLFKTVFCNPPYSNVTPWLAKAKAEAAKGYKVVMLLNYDHTTAWWQGYIEDPTNGFAAYPGVTVEKLQKRIKFVPPPMCLGRDGKPVKRTTNTRPSVVVIFHPNGISR